MQAWTTYGEVLLDDSLSKEELAVAHLLAALARYHTDNSFSAVQLGEQAEQAAIEAGADVLLGKVWANLCEFYRKLGDTHKAKETAEKWFAHLGLFPELADWQGRVQYNLALIKRARREPDHIEAFHKACSLLAEVLEKAPAERKRIPALHLIMAHQMASRVCYEAGRIAEGDRHFDLAQEQIDQHGQDDLEGIREQLGLRMARAYYLDDFPKVLELAKEFLAPGSPATRDQQFWACYFAGMVGAYRGCESEARVFQMMAADHAVALKVPLYMNKAAELMRFIAERNLRESGA